MIDAIVPIDVAVAEAFDDATEVVLFAEEEALIATSVDKRRREFTTVRHCARAALAQLGIAAAPIVHGDCGAPQWPAGVVGSMTHCQGYRAAAVAHARDLASIGVDAEPHDSLPDGVFDVIALPGESERVRELTAADATICWDRLLFSAKESVYKAWFPLTGRWLDFAEADIVIDGERNTFTARLLVPGPVVAGRQLTTFDGRFRVAGGLVITTICLPAPTPGLGRTAEAVGESGVAAARARVADGDCDGAA